MHSTSTSPESRSLAIANARAVLVALAVGFLATLTACLNTADMVPSDAGIAPPDVVEIEAGRGILFRSIDGARVNAGTIRTLPGDRSLRVDVRRGLIGLDGEKLEGMYHVGSCRLRFAAERGDRLEVVVRPFAEEREIVTGDKTRASRRTRVIGTTVHLVNRRTNRDLRATAQSCDMRIDCSKVDRFTADLGEECSF